MSRQSKPPLPSIRRVREIEPPLVHPSGRALEFRLLEFLNGSQSLEIASVTADGRVFAVRVPPVGLPALRRAVETWAAALTDGAATRNHSEKGP